MAPAEVLLTVELVAESLQGSAGRAVSQKSPERQIPALGVRLLDLAPAVIEAPDTEAFGASAESFVSFNGRGKALVVEMPIAASEAAEPIPLWLLALALQPAGVTRSAVLLASACIDLRQEVLRAISVKGGTSAPCTFRRCSFRMTPVRETSCNLQLDCFLRIYTGSHQPISGTELLLEPIAVAGAASPRRGGLLQGLGPRQPEQSTVETQTQPESIAASGTLEKQKQPKAVSASSTVETQTQPEAVEEVRPKVSTTSALPSRPAVDRVDGVFFADELRVQSAEPPQEQALDGPASPEVPKTGLEDCIARGPPDVPSSLPLVSELVRELYQIRALKT